MRDELAPVHHKYEAQGHVDREVWNRVGEQGFLGVCIPAEDGGIGGSFKDEAIVLEEQIYANCHAPAIGVWIHSGPENFKKSRQKKILKSNKSIFFRKIAFLAILNFFSSSKIDFWPFLKLQINGIWPKQICEIDLIDFMIVFSLDFLKFSGPL